MPNRALRDAQPTEQAICEVAVQLIPQVGYQSITLRPLATQVGVSPDTLYLCHHGKIFCQKIL